MKWTIQRSASIWERHVLIIAYNLGQIFFDEILFLWYFNCMKSGEFLGHWTTEQAPSRSLEVIRRASLGAALAWLAIAAPAQANHLKSKKLLRAAEQIEQRIKDHKPVRFDATKTIYWSRHNDKDNKFDFRTDIPLTARVGERRVLRYFGARQEGKTLKSVEVFPLPSRDILKAQSEFDPIFWCGAKPSSTGEVNIVGKEHDPVVGIIYEGDMLVPVQVGETRHFNKGSILVPPIMEPDPSCD